MKNLPIPILTILLVFLLQSCGNKTGKKNNEKVTGIIAKDSLRTDYTEQKEYPNTGKKVQIDFAKHKAILDIILLLPDTSFSSWEWKSADRIKWYNEIKANNFYIDDNPDFFNQKYFEPNKAGFSIVDGSWSINLYPTSKGSYIVITDDIVGDGHTLNFYEVEANKIKEYLNKQLMFSDFKMLLKKTNPTEQCNEKFEVLEDPIFDYDFSRKNKVEIEGSWHLTQENYGDCLNGNTILYNFNPQTKKFDVEKIYWKPKQSK